MEPKWEIIETSGKHQDRHESAFVECEVNFCLIGCHEANGCTEQSSPETRMWIKNELHLASCSSFSACG